MATVIDVQTPRFSGHQNMPAFLAGNGRDETACCPDTRTDSFLARDSLIRFSRATSVLTFIHVFLNSTKSKAKKTAV